MFPLLPPSHWLCQLTTSGTIWGHFLGWLLAKDKSAYHVCLNPGFASRITYWFWAHFPLGFCTCCSLCLLSSKYALTSLEFTERRPKASALPDANNPSQSSHAFSLLFSQKELEELSLSLRPGHHQGAWSFFLKVHKARLSLLGANTCKDP